MAVSSQFSRRKLNSIYTDECLAVLRALPSIGERPKLKQHIYEYINHRHKSQIQSLKDNYNLTFSDVDYAFPSPNEADLLGLDDLRDIINYDQLLFEKMTFLCIHSFIRFLIKRTQSIPEEN